MEFRIDVKDLGDNVSYHSASFSGRDAGHVMVGRDHQDFQLGRLIDLEVKPEFRENGFRR